MYQHIRILVAEDDEQDVWFLKRAFSKNGINAPMEFVADGQQAVDYLQGQGDYTDRQRFPIPNLMLVDIKMPRMDGFGLLEWLRKEPELRKLPVIILSSSSEPRDVNRAHELGANGYCTKPATQNDMAALVQALQSFWFRWHCYPRLQQPATGC